MNTLQNVYEKNKKWLCFLLISTFLWGLAAHGYAFMHSNFSHDSLNEFDGNVISNSIKYQSGRFLVPLSRAIFRTNLTLPWMIGILSLFWAGLAAFLTIKIFKIESKITAFLLAGIFTANLTVSCTTATFIHDLDSNMLALLFAVAAVYFWQRGKWYWLPASVLVTVSLALYQAFILVTVTLVLFVCILETMNAEKFEKVFLAGIKAIGMLLVGGGMYYVAMKFVLHWKGFQNMTGQFQEIHNPLELSPATLVYLVEELYYKYFKRMGTVVSPYPEAVTIAASVVLLMVFLVALAVGLSNRKIPILQKLLCVGLIVLLPFAMNLLHMVTGTHELMRFAYWLAYLLVLLMADWLVKWLQAKNCRFLTEGREWLAKLPKIISAVMIGLLLYSNVQVANVFYLKKDLEHEGYASLMTRILYRIEDYDAYEPGVTPVVLVGLPEQFQDVIPGFEDYTMPNGVQISDVMTIMGRERAQAYFDYYMNSPILFAEYAIWDAVGEDPDVLQLPNYPDDDCITMVDGTLVVKLGDSK